jgi:hypothetical protein
MLYTIKSGYDTSRQAPKPIASDGVSYPPLLVMLNLEPSFIEFLKIATNNFDIDY